MNTPSPLKLTLVIASVILCWAYSPIGVHMGLHSYSPGQLALLRFLIASVFMGGVAWVALFGMDEDGDGWVGIGGIGNRLRNAYPDFDQRSYGHAKLSDLIRATGRFDVEVGPGSAMRARVKRPDKRSHSDNNVAVK